MKTIVFNADSIRGLRLKKGLNAYQFAKRLGTTSQRIYQWENGTARPNVAALVKICNTFGVQPSYFFFFLNSKHAN